MSSAQEQPAVSFKENFLDLDGFRIRYMGAGQGDQVVILESATWGLSKVRDALANSYRVDVIELPGFGNSNPNPKSQSVRELAATAARAADQITGGHYTLVGTSFAANVAFWQALHSPERVDCLILISPTAILPNELATAQTQEESLRQLLAHLENVPHLTPMDPEIWAKEEELAKRLESRTHDAEAESKLREIRCPTLVVLGASDKMVAAEAARTYREKIPNSNISFVYDAGHLIEAERPEALIDAVGNFVEHRDTFIVGRGNQLINP